MGPANSESIEEIDADDSEIARNAGKATRAAFLKALESGGPVEVVRKGKIARILPSGAVLIVGTVNPKVRKGKLTYRLEWTPPSRERNASSVF
jgi:hypothetical protein